MIGFVLASIHFAEAQQPKKIPLVGYVSSNTPSSPGPLLGSFRQGLRDLGYIEGKSILVEYRYTEGDSGRAPSLVTELLQLNVDLLVIPNLPAMLAAKQATKTIPIVIVVNADPVALGLVDSLPQPGGNITGLATLNQRLKRKTAGIAYGGAATNVARGSSSSDGQSKCDYRF